MGNCNGEICIFNFCIAQQKVPFLNLSFFAIQVWGPFSGHPWDSHTCCLLLNVRNNFYEHCVLSTRIRWNFYDFLPFFSGEALCKVVSSLLVVFCRHCSRKFVVMFFCFSAKLCRNA